jgi:hypothetical protein
MLHGMNFFDGLPPSQASKGPVCRSAGPLLPPRRAGEPCTLGRQPSIKLVRSQSRPTTSVSLAARLPFDSLRDAPPPMVYVPFTQQGVRLKVGVDMMGLSLRTRSDGGSLERVLRRELAAANPAFYLRSVTT